MLVDYIVKISAGFQNLKYVYQKNVSVKPTNMCLKVFKKWSKSSKKLTQFEE